MRSIGSGRNRAKTPSNNFCEVEDAECFGGLATVQTQRNMQSRIELLHYHEAERPSERGVSPSPSEGRTVHTPQTQPAPAGGALVH